MKRITALILAICTLFAFSCSLNSTAYAEEDPYMLEYAMLTEPIRQEQIENEIYEQLSSTLGSEYLIDIQAFYESKEAIEEGLYNSRESEYFGFLLSEVDAQFAGTPYVFCLDENGNTVVREFVPYENVWGKVLTNVAIGTGVILVCVTVSALTMKTAPSIHLVFACAAENAARTAFGDAIKTAAKVAVDTYMKTNDVGKALEKAALAASEDFKYGAIAGAIEGLTAKAINLNGLRRANKMSADDNATIQKDSDYSDATIKNIRSMDEYAVYQNAKLTEYEYGGRRFLIPEDLDWDFVDPGTGMTNRQLVKAGYNPVDKQGIKYELHHIGQKTDSPLALLTREQHQSNTSVLHTDQVSHVRPNGNNTSWLADKKEALRLLSGLLDLIQ